MTLLRMDDVHTYYGRSYILQGVTLEIEKGEIVALLGRNGAGKTTTLKTIIGLVKPKGGRIAFKEADVTSLPAFKVARMGMAYVPQGRGLFSKMTVLENLKTALGGKSDENLLGSVLGLFPILQGRLSQKAGTLSGGEQQTLAISRALLTKPEIILLDEPTTGLMPVFVSNLKNIILRLNGEGVAILLVEEKVAFAMSVAHRIYFMDKGKIEHQARKEELDGRKEIFVRYLGVEF